MSASLAVDSTQVIDKEARDGVLREDAEAQATRRRPGACSDSDPFLPGSFGVLNFTIAAASKNSPGGAPRPLLVLAPRVSSPAADAKPLSSPRDSGAENAPVGNSPEAGAQAARPLSAPVVVFLHGFNLRPVFYSQLLAHFASHGFLAVAPAMYSFSTNPDASGEIKAAAETIEWLKAHFSEHLPSDQIVPPDFDSICIAGHSRGGKEAFGVALNLGGVSLALKAVMVLDPVDGTSNTTQTPPPILKHQPASLELGSPVLVIGSGLGPLGKWGIFPPCAPAWVGHEFFFSDSAAPAYHIRAKDYGHMDVLDDVTDGVFGKLTLCRSGGSRKPMRTFCAGVGVSFLRSVFRGQSEEFLSLLHAPADLPVEVDEVLVRSS